MMSPRLTLFALTLGLVVAACSAPEKAQPDTLAQSQKASAEGTHEHHAEEAASQGNGSQEPIRTEADGSRFFGQEFQGETEVTPLATVAASPADYDGKTVRTEGEIAQVCQAKGCWMEIHAEGAPNVRVPMAGHSFFLPPDVKGRRATVEGTVKVATLDEATQKHLEAEGAKAAGTSFSIDATTVLVHGASQ
ncbi:MAG: DUF4920 domain-containing protein [Myxococcales bacterium]|nr:DUF4920 domain-containing protein [Myxococcales bacterium]